jgi:SIR2-like domain
VITTNFDHVLEQVFKVAGRDFKEEEEVIRGLKPDEIIAAIHRNKHALLKIHGDCRARTFRVFTVKDYEKSYGGETSDSTNGQPEKITVGSLGWVMFINRPLLFLGCSLQADRTVDVLKTIQQQVTGLTHYALLAAHYSLRRWKEREDHLDALGVSPLWYVPRHFWEIESMLRELLERVSTTPAHPAREPLPPDSIRTSPPSCEESIHSFKASVDSGSAGPLSDELSVPIPLITRALINGKLAFFLGAYAHLRKDALGNELYRSLAEKFQCPALADNRAAVAAFVASRFGTGTLQEEVATRIREWNVCAKRGTPPGCHSARLPKSQRASCERTFVDPHNKLRHDLGASSY